MARDLNDVLAIFDRASANLERLQSVWNAAQAMLPTGSQFGGDAEYDELARQYKDLLRGLPPIDGFTLTEPIPDYESIGVGFFNYNDAGELPTPIWRELERPNEELGEYRYLLKKARGRTVRDRLQQLVTVVEENVAKLIDGVPRDDKTHITAAEVFLIGQAVEEIERLMGDATPRGGRWSDLKRHMAYSEGHDWHDINQYDWPSVKKDIELAGLTEGDPLPIEEDIDLGQLAGAKPQGAASTGLDWSKINDDDFEQLLHDLLQRLPEYENVQLLMKTNANDSGRDISAQRIIKMSGSYRNERVMVQAKHWAKSVSHIEVERAIADSKLWGAPVVLGVIIATTGGFTKGATEYMERHNATGQPPLIEFWGPTALRTLLSEHPDLAAGYGLR